MTRSEFDSFCQSVDRAMGHPQITWEGPQPHDFRNMKERGLRFVHSELFAKVPDCCSVMASDPEQWGVLPEDCAPDGKVYFKIAVGDDAALQEIGARVSSLGYQWKVAGACEYYSWITFEVVVNSAT